MRENCLLIMCGGEEEKNRRMDELLLDFYHKTKKATASKITKDNLCVVNEIMSEFVYVCVEMSEFFLPQEHYFSKEFYAFRIEDAI